jgi:hypothetical protein
MPNRSIFAPVGLSTFPEKRRLFRESLYPGRVPLRHLHQEIWQCVPLDSCIRRYGRLPKCNFQAHPFVSLGIESGFVMNTSDKKLRQICELS